MMAVLTPLGWLAAPLFKTLFDKAHHHLGTGIDEKMKILQATELPRLSLAIERAEKSPNKGKLVDWLKRLKGAYYEAEEAINLFEYELLKQKKKGTVFRLDLFALTLQFLLLNFLPKNKDSFLGWTRSLTPFSFFSIVSPYDPTFFNYTTLHSTSSTKK